MKHKSLVVLKFSSNLYQTAIKVVKGGIIRRLFDLPSTLSGNHLPKRIVESIPAGKQAP
jgi:hypothetical protein